MTIHIENLKFQTIIGILDYERTTPQEVLINLTITYTFQKDIFINYAEVSEIIEKTMQKEKFLLIEDALLFLSTQLKESFQAIEKLKLKISKPNIMHNSVVSVSETFLFNS